jgi:hypothetical protein
MVTMLLTDYGHNSVDTNSMMLMIYSAPTANAGGNGSVCKGQVYPLSGAASVAYTSLHWVTKGDGTFDNQASLHPTYTPGTQDITAGSVKLMFNVVGSSVCPTASDSLLLTIHGLPQIDLGRDTTTCANAAVSLNATNGSATGYLWLPSNKTTPVISVDSAGIGLHSQKITVFVTDNNGCVGKDSVNVAFKICGGIEDLAGVTVQVFPNPSNGMFAIELKTRQQETLDLSIIGPSGETVYTIQALKVSGTHSEKIDVSRLAQGIYILQISNGSGKMYRKIMIQK